MNDIIWTPGITLEQIELQVIKKAYAHFGQNKTQTSLALGIAVRTLDAKLDHIKVTEEKIAEAEALRHKENEDFLRRCRGLPQDEEKWPEPRTESGLVVQSAPGFEPEKPLILKTVEAQPKKSARG